MEDLEDAIASAQEILRNQSRDHPDRAHQLDRLVVYFGRRYDQTKAIYDLDQGVTYAQEAVKALCQERIHRAIRFTNLAVWCRIRYNRKNNLDDIENSVYYAQEALEDTPQDHPCRADRLEEVALGFSVKYIQTWSLSDLNKAVTYTREASQVTPRDHPKRADRSSNLGLRLHNRYLRTGSVDDLEQAIKCAQEAVEATPQDHPDRAGRLNNLGVMYGDRYDRKGSLDDLEQAMRHIREALRHISQNHPSRALYTSNIALRYSARYERTGIVDDLDQAIMYAREAVGTTPRDHPDRPDRLSSLGSRLGSRYRRTDDLDDLEQAIKCAQEAVEATPQDHPDRAGRLNNLGAMFHDKQKRTGSLDDRETSLQALKNAVECSASHPLSRIVSGRNALLILYQGHHWVEAAQIVQTLFSLLPSVCGRYLSLDDQQHALRQISGFAADACSVLLKLDRVDEALQRIEFGRVLILGYIMEGRSDISHLAQSYPDLAREYDELRLQPSRRLDSQKANIHGTQRPRQQHNLPRLLSNCERRIREKPGFEHFLQPPSVSELMEAATDGSIVIVNSTHLGSDAIIVTESAVETIRLPSMSVNLPSTFSNAMERHRAIEKPEFQRDIESHLVYRHNVDLLSWLWSTCVSLVLEKLAGCRPEEKVLRIWWIGTGAASALPLHAAGIYGAGIPSDVDKCLSRSISSYTPSIKSLKFARNVATIVVKSFTNERSLLVVTMPTTPGERVLPGVNLERQAIQEVVGRKWVVNSLAHPTASEVLEMLPGHNIVHFACHGLSDTNNLMESHLLLQQGDGREKHVDKLTISALLDTTTQAHSWVAYLSACSTAVTKVKALTDESLHLTSAFQAAGFAHVIGSLHPVDDEICGQVARNFYSFLVKNEDNIDQNRAIAEALNYATRQVAKEHPKNPELWAPFIHLGA
jgi:tetratricopeptide (TPR) repeat protein